MRRYRGVLALCYLPNQKDIGKGPSMKETSEEGRKKGKGAKESCSIQDAQKKQTKGTEATGGKNQSEMRRTRERGRGRG